MMKRFWRAGAVLFAAVMLSAALPAAAYAKESDYDYNMDYYGDMWWDGFVAHFESLDGAKKYDVNLARNDHHLTTVTTTKRSVNFKESMKRDGDYTFRVRGIRGSNTGEWGDWSEVQGYYNGELDKPSDDSHGSGGGSGSGGTTSGTWMRNGDRWWFCFADGSYPAGKWWQIDGKWYLFGTDGYMLTGWQQWNGKYYFLGADGAMLSNTWTPDGYYVGADGAWQQ